MSDILTRRKKIKATDWAQSIAALPTGLTMRQAAEALGAPYRVAYQWLKRFGYAAVNGRSCAPGARATKDWATVDWSRPQSEIARALGVSRQAVHHMKRRMAK